MNTTTQNPLKMLLHACCGPCTLEPSRLLREEGYELCIFYANSNIHPREEYERRLKTLRTWAASETAASSGSTAPSGCASNQEANPLPVMEGAYNVDAWEATAGRIGNTAATCADEGRRELIRKARCRACYRLRFEELARQAAEGGFSAIGTTLSVSPYQYADIIREELERAAEHAGLNAVFRDFRPFYDEATRRSRELGMYRQNYCGCRFSQQEAELEREERKAARRAAREAENALHAEERAAREEARAANRAEKQAYAEKQARKRALKKQMRTI